MTPTPDCEEMQQIMTDIDVEALAGRLEQLQTRVSELEDERAVREVLALYGFHADLGHEEGYGALWTSDGNYDWDGADLHGTAELVDLVKNPALDHKKLIENRSQHIAVNPLIRIDGDEAWIECYSIVMVGTPDTGYAVFSAGYNHFDLRRVDGKWLIKRRYRRHVGGPVWGGEVINSFQEAR